MFLIIPLLHVSSNVFFSIPVYENSKLSIYFETDNVCEIKNSIYKKTMEFEFRLLLFVAHNSHVVMSVVSQWK
jgi:hypothetical protein